MNAPQRTGLGERLLDPKILATVLSGVFALGSGIFSAYSSQQAAAARQSVEHVNEFSTQIQESIKALAASAGGEAAGNIELISLYSLAQGNYDDKRDVLYIAAASNNAKLLQSFGAMLENSTDPDDVKLRPEYRQLLSGLEAAQVAAPSGSRPAAPQGSDVAFPRGSNGSVNAAVAKALGDVTAPDATGWVYIGRAASTTVGAQLTDGYVSPHTIPATNPPAVLTTTGYLHLRNKSVTPEPGNWGPIVGVVVPGHSMRVERTVEIPFSKGGYGAWALVDLCDASCR